jgi:hypothetical protein
MDMNIKFVIYLSLCMDLSKRLKIGMTALLTI